MRDLVISFYSHSRGTYIISERGEKRTVRFRGDVAADDIATISALKAAVPK